MKQLKIVQKKVSALKPAEYNPRKLGSKDKMELTKSIKEFGLVDPIIVNSNPKRKNIVIGGHQRLKIAIELGYTEVPCVELNLSEDKERELNLRLNKNTGDFDFEILGELGEDLLREVGFNDSEIKRAIEGIGENRAEEEFTTEVLEENNYIVFTFDNSVDWLQVSEFFNLKTVQAKDSKKDYRRKGVGRVLDGKRLQELIDKI